MLYIVLVASLLHLGWMNLLAFLRADKAISFATTGVPAFFMGMLMVCSWPLLLQSVALGFLAAACSRWAPKQPRAYAAASVLIVAAILSVTAGYAKWAEPDVVAHFPMESMAERVPAPKLGRPHRAFAEKERWNSLEDNLAVEIEIEEKQSWSRSNLLRRVHENATENFINSPGFGISRGMRELTPDRIDRALEPTEPIAQPEASGPDAVSTEDIERPYAGQIDSLRWLHFGGVADFVNVKGFGYVKDRQHVAGFRSHQFSKQPASNDAPRLKRLELVSLLMHDKPVVYVSKELPRMSKLKKAATRGLSDFEAKGLVELLKGEDLFVRGTPEGILMLGAIRSVKQCVNCHGGERGDLLGAFSYSLTRVP